ncbi:hypothetical protein GGF32_008482 [Allomyces javanicus]|nr:hypothetical protein GGF32_008482 [Allomyces javanicus]
MMRRTTVSIRGAMLDALPNPIALTLPQFVAWVDDNPPTLPYVNLTASSATFAKLPDHALPTLECAIVGNCSPRLSKFPAACTHTLRQLEAEVIHARLVETLALMPRLEKLTVKRLGMERYAQPLAEWRLLYLQGNPVWSVVPSMDLRNFIAEKLVVNVPGEVRDLERMEEEIWTMKRWCPLYFARITDH